MSNLFTNIRAKAKTPWGACNFLTRNDCEEVSDAPMTRGSMRHTGPTSNNARVSHEVKDAFTVVRRPYERATSAHCYEAKKLQNG